MEWGNDFKRQGKEVLPRKQPEREGGAPNGLTIRERNLGKDPP